MYVLDWCWLIKIFFFSSSKVNVEKQVYVHTTEYYIGVVGGYLGLFLGGSILGFVEFMENYIAKAFFTFYRNT